MEAIELTIVVGAALSLTALSVAIAASDAASHHATVSAAGTGLGKVVAEASGRMLYLFEQADRRDG
jgi:predicted lipoprotein with Yx(FWY)xxD motif